MQKAVPHASLSEKPKGPGKTPRETYNSSKVKSLKLKRQAQNECKSAERKPMQRPAICSSNEGAHEEVSGNHSRYVWLIRPDISTELDTSQVRG